MVGLLEKFNAEAAKRAAAMPNSPELVKAAQAQLARIGCFSGKVDGALGTIKSGLDRYTAIKGAATKPTAITEDFVSELTKEPGRVCPLECKAGETVKGEVCVANQKSTPPVSASGRRNHNAEDDRRARSKSAKREVDREQRRKSLPAPAPQARQQAVARPSGGGGGGGGGAVAVAVTHGRRGILIGEYNCEVVYSMLGNQRCGHD